MKPIVSLVAIALTAAACGKGKDAAKDPPAPSTTTPAPAPAPSTTTPTPPAPSTTTPTPPAPSANTPHTTDHPSRAKTAVVEGTACTTGLRPVSDVAIGLEGPTLSFTRDRGGGCPTRAVYTAFFTRANPPQIRLCEDPGADTCEMMIVGEQITIDLTPAFAAAGATSAVLAK